MMKKEIYLVIQRDGQKLIVDGSYEVLITFIADLLNSLGMAPGEEMFLENFEPVPFEIEEDE